MPRDIMPRLTRCQTRHRRNTPTMAPPLTCLAGKVVDLDLPPHAAAILRLMDGSKPLQEIHRQLGADIDWIAFHQQFSALYESLNQYNKMTIRYQPMA